MPHFITDSCTGCRACARACPSRAISGEKKERHAVRADRCIDCGACGRTCPEGAVEDPFGLPVERVRKKDRPIPVFDLDACMSCNICIDACPTGALAADLQKAGSRRPYPVLADASLCMACGFCADDCPVGAVALAAGRQEAPAGEDR